MKQTEVCKYLMKTQTLTGNQSVLRILPNSDWKDKLERTNTNQK